MLRRREYSTPVTVADWCESSVGPSFSTFAELGNFTKFSPSGPTIQLVFIRKSIMMTLTLPSIAAVLVPLNLTGDAYLPPKNVNGVPSETFFVDPM